MGEYCNGGVCSLRGMGRRRRHEEFSTAAKRHPCHFEFRRGRWADKKKSLLFLMLAAAGGLVGFVWSILIANAIRFVAAIIWGFATKKSAEKEISDKAN